ncbi:MAG: hypothetical protein M3N21_08820 [Actinomycetota bacterium]|nr:hypothetical protein [Actinomycetota bacterium]
MTETQTVVILPPAVGDRVQVLIDDDACYEHGGAKWQIGDTGVVVKTCGPVLLVQFPDSYRAGFLAAELLPVPAGVMAGGR